MRCSKRLSQFKSISLVNFARCDGLVFLWTVVSRCRIPSPNTRRHCDGGVLCICAARRWSVRRVALSAVKKLSRDSVSGAFFNAEKGDLTVEGLFVCFFFVGILVSRLKCLYLITSLGRRYASAHPIPQVNTRLPQYSTSFEVLTAQRLLLVRQLSINP